jgi:hypothetical protein
VTFDLVDSLRLRSHYSATPEVSARRRLPNGLRAGGRRVEVFVVGSGLGPDLAYLMSLVANNRLDASVGWRGSWDRAREAMDALLARSVEGKAVLELP